MKRRGIVSEAEELLASALAAEPLEGWDLTREYAFHPERAWRFDFAFPSLLLAVEVEGRYHTTYAGHRKDCEKFNEAALLGWRVLRFPAAQKARAAEWAELIRRCLLLSPPVRRRASRSSARVSPPPAPPTSP